jgi:hypothetical protein
MVLSVWLQYGRAALDTQVHKGATHWPTAQTPTGSEHTPSANGSSTRQGIPSPPGPPAQIPDWHVPNCDVQLDDP